MIVAQLRGVKFRQDFAGYWCFELVDREKAVNALLDITLWLGFGNVGTYLEALPNLRQDIFERAKD